MIRILLISIALLGAALPAQAQQRPRGGAAQAVDGLEAPVFARGLGEIADLALGSDGTVFAADARSGRIWAIRDRGLDGAADTVQALAPRFDRPSGLAVGGDTVFVADRGGLWRLRGAGTPELLAPLARAGALDEPHPIAAMPDGSLRLGLSLPDGTGRVVSVDTATGEARLLSTVPGPVLAFSKGTPGTPVLTLVDGPDGVRLGAGAGPLSDIGAEARAAWADAQASRVVLSGPGGVSVHRGTLMGVEREGVVLLRGLEAGAVLMDRRGVLVASPGDGTIRLVRPARLADETPADDAPPAPETTLDPDMLILRGSGIDRASRYDDFKAAEDE